MRNAIEAERAAARFYDRLVGKASDEETRRFLTEMAAQERDHARAIEEIAGKIGNGELPTRPDTRVTAVETAPAWAEAESLDLDQALALALDAENSAALYYDALADFCDLGARSFFERMVAVEEEHARRLRELIARRAD
jgi:rubrerythrin